ncbi:hypothetical protein O3M35_001907 [Rhynocoris fuscipes]|uniref:Peptidase S1 domain-containing protein n=1 Tax=Rhynocoris fuscipes TaxID=488301 RepID=A0AAW1CWX6_9HEMI
MERKNCYNKILTIFLLTFHYNYLLTCAADEVEPNDTLYGDVVDIRRAPYLALIKTDSGICTGTIISEDRILTSSPCFKNADVNTKIFVGATTDIDYDQELHITNIWRAAQTQDEKFPVHKFGNLVLIEVGGINLVSGKVEIMPLQNVIQWKNGSKSCFVAAYREIFNVLRDQKPHDWRSQEVGSLQEDEVIKKDGETENEDEKVIYLDLDETKKEISNTKEESEEGTKDTKEEEDMKKEVASSTNRGKQSRISRDVSRRRIRSMDDQVVFTDENEEAYEKLEMNNRMIGAQLHLLPVTAGYGRDACNCPNVEKGKEYLGGNAKGKEVIKGKRTKVLPRNNWRQKREDDSSNVICSNYDGKPTCFANTGGPLICNGILMGIGASIMSCDKQDYNEEDFDEEKQEVEDEEENEKSMTEKGMAAQKLDKDGNIVNEENNIRPEEIATGGNVIASGKEANMTTVAEEVDEATTENVTAPGEIVDEATTENVTAVGEEVDLTNTENMATVADKVDEATTENINAVSEEVDVTSAENINAVNEKVDVTSAENIDAVSEEVDEATTENINAQGKEVDLTSAENMATVTEKVEEATTENINAVSEEVDSTTTKVSNEANDAKRIIKSRKQEVKETKKRRKRQINHVKDQRKPKVKRNNGKNQTFAIKHELDDGNPLQQALRSFITPECHDEIFFDTFTFLSDFKDWLDIAEYFPSGNSFLGSRTRFKLGDKVKMRGEASRPYSQNMALNLLLSALVLFHKYIF